MIFKRGGVENRGFGGGRGERSYQEIDLDEIYLLNTNSRFEQLQGSGGS